MTQNDQFDNMMNGGTTGEGDGLVLDLGNVDENAPMFEPMPPGTYPVLVDNVEFRESSTGNPMLSWTFQVQDPEFENRKLFWQTVLNKEAGLANLKRALIRIMPEYDFAQGFNPQQFCDEGTIIGQEARVKVNIRPYQGEKRNNVQEVLAPDNSGDFM